MPRPADELPQNVPDHMKLMLDLMVLAFQMDKTRIVTCMLNNDLSQMNFRFLEGVQGALAPRPDAQRQSAGGGGDVSEDESVPRGAVRLPGEADERDRRGRAIAARQLDAAVLLEPVRRRCARRRPDADAARGHGGGTLKPGRILDYLDKGDDNRRACSLYLSMMDRMGVKLDRFGDTQMRA